MGQGKKEKEGKEKGFLKGLFSSTAKAIKDYPIILFFAIGIIAILLRRSLPVEETNSIKIIDDLLTSFSIAIFGAGIFTVVSKSKQFSDLFNHEITKVIYTPGEYQKDKELRNNWTRLTVAYFEKVLPIEKETAINHLLATYFSNALDYHLFNHRVFYTVKWIDLNNGIIEVLSRTESTIIPNPESRRPVFRSFQKVNENGLSKIIVDRLKLGDVDYKDDVKETSKDGKKGIEIDEPLTSHEHIKLDKIVRIHQSQKDENFLKGKIIRYCKNLTVGFKFVKNPSFPDAPVLSPRLEAMGFNQESADSFIQDILPTEEETFEYEWVVDGLLFPGQGYIIMLYEDSEIHEHTKDTELKDKPVSET